ncbi:unnamed protein product [Mytilus edulis]|uniref:Homeobox domain-containing protein n=1 Tax=Mytilus edulis TaxID=6550 RepID=A0A8S3SHE4_MYTED|nr:unnamed protein product [Mytilus edulis]
MNGLEATVLAPYFEEKANTWHYYEGKKFQHAYPPSAQIHHTGKGHWVLSYKSVDSQSKTEENLQILEELYQSGMTSKGKSSESFHKEAESKTGLQLQVIKDWIGNRKKKESGRKYEYKKAHYSRGISAYNCFVSEKNSICNRTSCSQDNDRGDINIKNIAMIGK